MNKQQLANKIWESANKMRSKIEANEYKDYILGFIFYKFLSDKEVKYLKSIGFDDDTMEQVTEDAGELVENVQKNIGYFISYENLFSTWLSIGSDFNVSNVRDALSAFSRLIDASHKKVFDKIFETLQTGLSKLGDSSGTQTKAISDLIHLIKDIPMDGKQDYDVLGFIYEYLISNFAANAGKKAGEFYTPHEVSLLMSEIVANHLKDRTEIKIYDPTSGSGSLLINIGKSVAKYMGSSDKIKYYAQELKENTYNLTRMNLVMRGIIPSNIVTRNGDTLEDDWPYFDESDPVGTYDPLYVDAVVSNPPYSQNWNPVNKENDPRYKRYGTAPKGKADYSPSFTSFLAQYLNDRTLYVEKHGPSAKPIAPPPNLCMVGMLPWVSFTHYSPVPYQQSDCYFPVIEAGKFFEQNGRTLMPLSVMAQHAVADGYHTSILFNGIQAAFLSPQEWIDQ